MVQPNYLCPPILAAKQLDTAIPECLSAETTLPRDPDLYVDTDPSMINSPCTSISDTTSPPLLEPMPQTIVQRISATVSDNVTGIPATNALHTAVASTFVETPPILSSEIVVPPVAEAKRRTKHLSEYATIHKNVQQARQRASTALTRNRDHLRTKIMKLTNQKTAYPAWQNFNRFTKQEKFVESVPPKEFETLIPRYSENCFLASKALDDVHHSFLPFRPSVKPIASNATLSLIGSRENAVNEKTAEISFVLHAKSCIRLLGTSPLKKFSKSNLQVGCVKINDLFGKLPEGETPQAGEDMLKEIFKMKDKEKMKVKNEKKLNLKEKLKMMDEKILKTKDKKKSKLKKQESKENSNEELEDVKIQNEQTSKMRQLRTPSSVQKKVPMIFNASQFAGQLKQQRASAESARGVITFENYNGTLAPSVGIGQVYSRQKASKIRRGKVQKKNRAPKWVFFMPSSCVVRPSHKAKIQVSTVKQVQGRRRKRKVALKGYPLDFVRSVISCFPRVRVFSKGKVKYEKATSLDISYLKTKRLKPSNARKLQKDRFTCFTACGWYRAQLRNLANRTKPVALPPYDKKKERFDPYRRRLIPKCQYKPIPMPVDFKIPLTPKWNKAIPSNYAEVRQNYTKYMYKRHDIRIRKEYNFHWNEYIEPRETKYQNTPFRKPELYSRVS